MKISFSIEEFVDGSGTASYRARYTENGWNFVSNWAETEWEAISDLCIDIAGYDDDHDGAVSESVYGGKQ